MIVRELLVTLGVKRDGGSFDRADSSVKKLVDAGKALGAVFVTGAVAQGFNSLINLASDAAEEANKFQAVFGNAAAGVDEQISGISERTGAASEDIKSFAANIGALVKPALGSARAAGDVGARVAELALDVASFNNLEPTEALEKLRAGLIGSSEPLQSVGVDVRDTSDGMKAYAESIGVAVKDMTGAQKTMARLSVITKSLGEQGALGDATRTAEGFANASRNLSANMRQLGADIGSFFLKSAGKSVLTMQKLVRGIRDFIKRNRELIQSGIDKFLEFIDKVVSAFVDNLVLLWKGIDAVYSALDDLMDLGPGTTRTIMMIAGAIAALVVVLGLPVVFLLAISAAIAVVLADLDDFRKGNASLIGDLIKEYERLKRILGDAGEAIVQLGGKLVYLFTKNILGLSEDTAKGVQENFVFAARAILRAFRKLGEAIGTVLGSAFVSVSELVQGNFGAAGRAIRQGIKDLSDIEWVETQGEADQRAARVMAENQRARAEATAAAASRSGTSASVSAQTNVTVTPAPGQDEEAIGRGIGRGLAEEQGRQLRNAQAATVGQGAY